MLHRSVAILALLLLTWPATARPACAAAAPAPSVDLTSAKPAPPPPPPAPTGEEVIFEDASGQSSATVSQVLPNSTVNLMTLGAVRRIRVRQGMLIVEWGDTATLLLPIQYVGSISLNKRAHSASPAAAPPAPMSPAPASPGEPSPAR